MYEIDLLLLLRLILSAVSVWLFYKIYTISRWNGFLFFVLCQIFNLLNRIVLLTGVIDSEPFNTISILLSVIFTVLGAYGVYIEFEKVFEGVSKKSILDNELLYKNLQAAEANLVEARTALRIIQKNLERMKEEKSDA